MSCPAIVLASWLADSRISSAAFSQASCRGLFGGRSISRLPDSAIKSACPRAKVHDEQRFRALVKAAFSQRRKTLWNALKALPGGRAALEGAGIDPQRRGETLSVEEFARVERALP